MNLPNDVSRCAGRLDFGHGPESVCPHRETCARHIQLMRESENNNAGRLSPVMMHCLVDGEYTMRIET